ncbi:MAG: 3-keto-5-aminohexanoate cleavage protein [Eubacteriales bacterium]|nr:3-keto-5-aminohexanoate cleavage protein [Eubacteriales bacterium]
MTKRILNCAITGSIHVPSMSPYLPITQDEIAQNAIDAANAGASAIHIHARNPENGMPSPDLGLYEEIIGKIRDKNKDVIICITTGGGAGMTVEQRVAVVPKFKPELASMNAGSINWGLFPAAAKIKEFKYPWEKAMLDMTKGFIFQNTFADMEVMIKTMNANGTKPELECYDVGHVYNVKFLQDVGLVQGKPYLQFVLGINGALGSAVEDLNMMKQTADRLFGVGGYEWSAFGAGKAEFPICTQNLFLGGHVRVGMEDNLYLGKGVMAKNNGELVEKMVRIMGEFDYEPATPDEAREMLGIKK